jgi:small-conductance mechanosensitive channel
MGRPAGWQWQPLGWTEDPVPGDPAQISQEAQHLAAVAAQITDQVSALQQIASDGTEIGAHADTIRSNAGTLSHQLDKLVGRYQQVSSILNSWVPDLEQAQSMSIQALNQAEGPHQQLNQTVVLPSGSNMTPAEQRQVQHYHNAMQQAQGQLDDARALLNRAIALRDSSGASSANAINNACNDGMRDHHSVWGSVESFFTGTWSWVTKNWSQIVGDICTVLEVLATIAAIAAFILAQFVP